jgi:hypothetical protein
LRLREQVQDDLAIDRRLKMEPRWFEFVAQDRRADEDCRCGRSRRPRPVLNMSGCA